MASPIDWTRYSIHYDALLSLRPYRKLLADVAEKISCFQPEKILDAACGTGNLLLFAARHPRLAQATFFGIDRNDNMLRLAAEKAFDAGIHASFSNQSLDEKLSLGNDSFDCVASVNTLYAVSDPELTLREFSRVLRKGGVLVITTPKKENDNGLILKAHCGSLKPDEYWTGIHDDPEREIRLLQEAFPDAEQFEAILEVATRNKEIDANQSFHFFQRDSMASLLERAGFSVSEFAMAYAEQNLLFIARKH